MPSSAFAADARQGAPVRWITAADLSDWADRRDGQAELPQLISRLALATYGPQVALRFPSGDSVGFPGWDGVLDAPVADSLFPVGKSVWEIGTQREKIRDKADKDYTKRTADPLGLDPKSATYVFVTPRRWPGKQQWMAARATEGRWADVLALDGDDLVHALDRYTSVAHWLAHRIGKRPDGLRLLDEIWKEWSLATQRPLTRDLILAGRADQASAVMKWLRAAPSVLPLRAESTEEALAFLYAAIAELPRLRRPPCSAGPSHRLLTTPPASSATASAVPSSPSPRPTPASLNPSQTKATTSLSPLTPPPPTPHRW